MRADVGDRGVRQREIRDPAATAFSNIWSANSEVLARQAPGVALALQVEVVGLQVLGRLGGERFLLLRRERDAQRLGDLVGDLVLDLEDVLHLAVVALRPDREVGRGVDELGVDPQPVAGPAQAALEHVGGAELLADLRRGRTGLSRKASTVEREKVFSALIFDSSVMMSSVMPSRKYSSSFTPDRFSK